MKLGVAISLGLAAWAMPAAAEWQKVESDHFVIYADDRPEDVRKFAEMLERYHDAMEFVVGFKGEKPSPSNRVTVYSMGKASDIQQLSGWGSKYLQGFYIPRAAGSVAFVPDMRSTRGEPDAALTTLLHEYTHHYLISSQRTGMPRWVSEGAAEFYASAVFLPDGGVNLGKPNVKRGYELFNADKVSIEELLDEGLYAKRTSKRYDSFYGRSWLLYHYLMFSPERKGQISTYLRAYGSGAAPLEAARTAFGDLAALDKDLEKYLRNRRWLMYSVPAERLSPGNIAVSALSEGHAKMMPVIVRSRRGVDEKTAKEVLAEARAAAASYTTDGAVQAALAEAEFDAGNDAEAIAAADRAIAANPKIENAYVQKGYALFRQAKDASDQTAAYAKAMGPFTRLNRMEPDHPLPLIYLYRSFVERGMEPSETARHALEKASVVAPFDLGLTFQVGTMLAKEGKIALARDFLQPVASSPHGGRMAQVARTMITQLDGKPEGTPVSLAAIVVPDVQVDEGGDAPAS